MSATLKEMELELFHDKKPTLSSGSTASYYELPKGAKELQDLIEYKNMNFAVGNIFKATYRLSDKHHSTAKRELEKIIFFAKRELKRIKNA